MRKSTYGWIAAGALVVALVAAGAVSLGASGEDEALTPADTEAMRSVVDRYWAAKQAAWPEAEQGKAKLTDESRERLREARKSILELTAGNVKEWEEDFDPAGFLEESRATGVVTLESGYRILKFGEPELISKNTCQLDVTVWSWGKEAIVGDDGTVSDDVSKADSTVVYRYTFERIGDQWKLANEDLRTNPLDPDSEQFGPSEPQGEI